jgi:hypothetical protein
MRENKRSEANLNTQPDNHQVPALQADIFIPVSAYNSYIRNTKIMGGVNYSRWVACSIHHVELLLCIDLRTGCRDIEVHTPNKLESRAVSK